ncbi:FIST N-terminal domain-containing protein, partial [Pseudomonas sp. KHB2.9]
MHNHEGVVSAMSLATDAGQAAEELAEQLLHPYLGFVLFFCSASYDLQALGQALQRCFGNVRLVGCTSAGEITPQGYGRNCVTAMGFNHAHFSIATELIDQVEHFSLIDAQHMVERLVGGCRSNTLAPIKGNTFALTLLDGLSSREE